VECNLLLLAEMFNKLLSFHSKIVSRSIFLNDGTENAHGLKQFLNKCELCSRLGGYGWKFRDFHVYGPHKKSEGRREMYASLPVRDEGTDGEKGVDIDSIIKRFVYPENVIFQLGSKVQYGYLLLCLLPIWQDGVFVGRKGHFKLCSRHCIIYVVQGNVPVVLPSENCVKFTF
jgi:hypothetical protein